MMERVVDPDDGVAPGAAVPGYRVAGKTGTAQRVGEECGCYDGTFTVSFAGFAPADDPRFTVYVVVQNPRNGGGGGSVAGPAFAKLMGYTLRRYGVPPTGTHALRGCPSSGDARPRLSAAVTVARVRGEAQNDRDRARNCDDVNRPAGRPPVERPLAVLAGPASVADGADVAGDGRHGRHRHLAELAAGPARRPVRRAARARARTAIDFVGRRGGAVPSPCSPTPRARRCRRRAPARSWSSTGRGQVLGRLAAGIYGDPPSALRMIGVTGTQGKTTTTRLPRRRCSAAGVRAAVVGTVGTRIVGEGREDRADHAGGARPARRCSR